jgi:hypothetical protein
MSALLFGLATVLFNGDSTIAVGAAEDTAPTPHARKDGGWVSLFSGRDLSGWETCLGTPPSEKGPLGVGHDPKRVFQVVVEDGEPAIRISGEVLAGLATKKEFGNYWLQLEFKWGEKRFPPRADLPRDSGLLYHGVDGCNPATGWLESAEFGILEGGETGDFYSVPGRHGMRVLVDVRGQDIPPRDRRYPEQSIRHRPGGRQYSGTTAGILNSDDNEKPRGRWNTLELLCLGQEALHVVNGSVNLVLTNFRRHLEGREVPLTSGRLQLQSEGAEVFFRRIRIRPIREIPLEYHDQARRDVEHNTLTEAERRAGWRLLFDGRSLDHWRGYRRPQAPGGWQAAGGALTRVGTAGDLITTETFDDFELAIDWKISHGGNSGIFYRATEEGHAPYETGPEFEIRDNAFWLDDPYTSGANYGLHPPARDATRPVGYWNHARIVVRGDHVEHWLNGERVVAYELHSLDWQKRVEASKYHQWPAYGRAERGHIGLQDHGDRVWFRNIKIRTLGGQ